MIRNFQIRDLDSVMDLWLKTNIQTHYFIPKEYWSNHFDMVKAILPTAQVFVCEYENTINGFIGIENGYIAGIFIDEKMQSQGIGKQLLEKAKQQYPTLSLSVYQKNSKAIAFYQREGFVIKNEQIDENTHECEVCMQWKK